MKYSIFNKDCDGCESGEEAFGALPMQDMIWKAQLENFREIIINTEIDSKVIEKVVMQIQNINRFDDSREADKKSYVREPITIFINSPGGLLSESMCVADAIMCSRTPVTTVALGTAASGGFLILIAGDERYAQRHSNVMYHQLSAGALGKVQDMWEHVDNLTVLQERIHTYVKERTKITDEDLLENLARKHDWYFSLEEMLEKEVIHGVWGLTAPIEEDGEEEADDSEDDDPCLNCELDCDTECPINEEN